MTQTPPAIVSWSVTCNGVHTGNAFPHRADAMKLKLSLDKVRPEDRREVVPLTEWRAPRWLKQQPLTENDIWNSDELMALNGAVLQLQMPDLIRVVRAVEKLHRIGEPETPQ